MNKILMALLLFLPMTVFADDPIVPAAAGTFLSTASVKLAELLKWANSHYDLAVMFGSGAFAFLTAKVWPNSTAPKFVQGLQGICDSVALLFHGVGDAASFIGKFCHDLVKSDGIAGRK